MEAESIIVAAIKILIFEPTDNPEGLLARRAMHELKQLRSEKNELEKNLWQKDGGVTKTRWFFCNDCLMMIACD